MSDAGYTNIYVNKEDCVLFRWDLSVVVSGWK